MNPTGQTSKFKVQSSDKLQVSSPKMQPFDLEERMSKFKDFRNKVHIAKKEVQETKHWLRMLKPCYPEHDEQIMTFWQEAHEFTLIVQTIVNKISQKVEV